MRLRRSAALVLAAMAATSCLDRPARSQEGNPPPAANLSARYNLVERFTTKESKPGYVGQYQVRFRETISSSARPKYSRTFQFSERAAVVPDDRRPTDVVRHYDFLKIDPAPANEKPVPRVLDDLTVWCREIPGQEPLIISLTPNRSLAGNEYEFANTNDFVHKLTFLLSPDPVRVAEPWRMAASGILVLTNLPDIDEAAVTATLSEVRAHPSGSGQQAVIDLSGRLHQTMPPCPDNETTLRAQLLFAFTPSTPAGGGDGVIDGFGAIEKLSLSQVETRPDPKSGKRPWRKRELVLERRFPGTGPILAIPEPPPTPTPENSWLSEASADGEFHLRHPQDFEFKLKPPKVAGEPEAPWKVALLKPDAHGLPPEFITFDFYSRTVTPEEYFDRLKADWKQGKVNVIPNLSHRLPDQEWPDMAVHQMEAVITPQGQRPEDPAVRRYSYAYVIQFTRSASIVVTANTFAKDPTDFHKQVEVILKTLKLGPP